MADSDSEVIINIQRPSEHFIQAGEGSHPCIDNVYPQASTLNCNQDRNQSNRADNFSQNNEKHHLRGGPSIKPQTFTGSEDWEIYINHFDVCAELARWSERDKTLALMASLRGEAQNFCMTLHPVEREQYSCVVHHLAQRFGKKRQQPMWMTRFESRLKNPEESFAKLGDDLKCLAQRAYPFMSHDAHEMLALNQLYKSVPPEIKFKCLTEQCITIDKAVAVIEMYEGVFNPGADSKFQARATSSSTVKNATEQESSTLARIESAVQEMQNCVRQLTNYSRGQRFEQPAQRRCYNCQSPGHFRRNCPHNRDDGAQYGQHKMHQWSSTNPQSAPMAHQLNKQENGRPSAH